MAKTGDTKNRKFWGAAQKHLMTATGYMIPFVVAGGVIYAMAVMLGGQASEPTTGWLKQLAMIGHAGLTLFIPALGGYLAYSMADRPGLAPGFITAYLATEMKAGFIGGIIGGIVAGLVIVWLKKIKVPGKYSVLTSIFLYPLVGTLISGGIMVFLIGEPISVLMTWLTHTLNSLSGAAKVPLGALMGAMIGVDMGGPINKVAATFAQTQVDTLPYLMGCAGAAICTPPIGMGIATILFRKKFSPVERDTGKAAILMGFCGITEGAIPFATSDPLRVIPANTIGSVVAGASAMLFGSLSHAPWGGLIVLPVVDNRWGYIISIAIGSIVTAVIVGCLKKDYVDESTKQSTKDDDLDFVVEDF